MYSLLLFIVTSFLSETSQQTPDRNKIRVRFLDRVGNREHDVTYVNRTVSTVEFTCICSRCATAHLFIVAKNISFEMKPAEFALEEWTYTMDINADVSLGEYRCGSDNNFASYNWTYRMVNRTCTVVYENSTESCGMLNEDHCLTTHSFRPMQSKSVTCDIRTRTVLNSLCEAVANDIPYPHIEIFGDDEKDCQLVHPMYNASFTKSLTDLKIEPIYPYTILLLHSVYSCSYATSVINYGQTLYLDKFSNYLYLCFIQPNATGVSAWIDNNLTKFFLNEDHGFTYTYKLKQQVYRFNIVFEGKTGSNALFRTYAHFIYFGGQPIISEVSSSCVNRTRASTLLRCILGKVHPVEEFKIRYRWKHLEETELWLNLWSDALNATREGKYQCDIFVAYSVDEPFSWNDIPIPDFQVEYNVTLDCPTVSMTDASVQAPNVAEIYLYIIIALSVLIFSIILSVGVFYIYKRWKKKQVNEDLYGANETAVPSEESILHPSSGSS